MTGNRHRMQLYGHPLVQPLWKVTDITCICTFIH